jgi:hypothetical protein
LTSFCCVVIKEEKEEDAEASRFIEVAVLGIIGYVGLEESM